MDDQQTMDDQQSREPDLTDDPALTEQEADERQEADELSGNEQGENEQNARRRFFNRAERFVLQAGAGGRCEECGVALGDSFHADHRHPFAAGGPTDLANAQALCPDCNRRKAARLLAETTRRSSDTRPPLPAWDLPLRPWQQRGAVAWQRLRTLQAVHDRTLRALEERAWQSMPGAAQDSLGHGYLGAAQGNAGGTNMTGTNISGTNISGTNISGTNMTGTNMTVTATPGSGKTNLALFLAARELRDGNADLLVVVVPTRTLKDQWATSAHRAGLSLTAGWGNNSVALLPDVHGCIVTYAQVASLPDALRLLCARHRVFCVLDEVHHCAESRAWGEALFQALEHAACRLCLSGTAWRQDGNMIPFVRYDGAGNSHSDVSYSYAEALRDGVVRDAFFFALEARTVWLAEEGEVTATFADVLSERDQSRRLRAALHAEGGWMEAAILRADAALSAARRGPGGASGHPLADGHPQPNGTPQTSGHPQAKGLVVTMNAAHARAVAARMLSLTGEMPAIALSDDPASLGVLTRFRSGGGRWLVVCRMAGEGYDCPDIRVVLWATNVTGEGAFRQLVARALRVVPGLVHQDAQVFLPADQRLMALARGLVRPSGRSLRTEGEENKEGDGNENSNGSGDNGANEENGGDAVLDLQSLLDPQGGEGDSRGEGTGLFVPLTSHAFGQRMMTNGAVVPASAMQRARAMNTGPSGFSGLPDYALAAVIARMDSEANELEPEANELEPEANELEGIVWGRSTLGLALPEAAAADPGAAAGLRETNQIREIVEPSSNETSERSNESETDVRSGESGTYDQRRQELRRLCTRLTALVARELNVNPAVVHRAFHRSLGVRQADSTLAQLERRKQQLEDKLRQLRVGGR